MNIAKDTKVVCREERTKQSSEHCLVPPPSIRTSGLALFLSALKDGESLLPECLIHVFQSSAIVLVSCQVRLCSPHQGNKVRAAHPKQFLLCSGPSIEICRMSTGLKAWGRLRGDWITLGILMMNPFWPPKAKWCDLNGVFRNISFPQDCGVFSPQSVPPFSKDRWHFSKWGSANFSTS